MKKLLMSLSFIVVLFANDCSIYLERGMEWMNKNAYSSSILTAYSLRAMNYFELYKICKKGGLKVK